MVQVRILLPAAQFIVRAVDVPAHQFDGGFLRRASAAFRKKHGTVLGRS